MRTLKRTYILLVLTLMGIPLTGLGQSLNLDFLFKPGFTIGNEYMGKGNLSDSGSFVLAKQRIQLTIPLKTKVNFDLFKLDVKGHQSFLTFNASLREADFIRSLYNRQNIQTYSMGFTSLRAGIKKGIWLYSINGFVSESSESFDDVNFNAMAYVARIKIKSTSMVYFYGLGGVYNYGRIVGTPIGGFIAKLDKKWRLTAILPIQAKLTYKLNNKNNLQVGSTFSGLNTVNRFQGQSMMNYRQLKSHLIYNSQLNPNFRLTLEAGWSSLKQLSIFDGNSKMESLQVEPSFYGGIGIKYSFGNSLFQSSIEGLD